MGCSAVATAVAAASVGAAVGGTGVAVGGIGVAVGGTAVGTAVGGTSIALPPPHSSASPAGSAVELSQRWATPPDMPTPMAAIGPQPPC